MARIFRFIIFAIIAGFSGGFVTLLLHAVGVVQPVGTTELSYADFVSIMLTALGLMITVLGFFVAAAGVIGWTTLENKLKDHSVTYFKEQLSKNGKLREEMEQLIVSIAHEGIGQYKSKNSIDDKSNPVEEEQYAD